MSVIYEISSK